VSALSGVRVLDFTRMHSGPFAAMILGDLGADVLKIEPPNGDETRRMTLVSYPGLSAFFAASNRNKRSLVLDLHDPSTRPELERLIAGADIVIDNFRPSTLRRFELDYDHLVRVNPNVIAVTVTGYGDGSPEADSPAYDLLAQARSGMMALTGDAGGPPYKAGGPIGDIVAGVYAATGALAALHERERTGRGQRVEVAMLDATIAMVHYHFSYFDASGQVLPRVGNEHHNMVPYGVFRCGDGHLAIAAVPEPPKFFVELCECLGHPEWVHDERFATADARRVNREELKALLEGVLTTGTKAEWFERLRARGVPVAPVNEVADLPQDVQVLARDMLVSLTSPTAGTIRLPGNPIKMRGARPLDEWAAPPALGAGGAAGWDAAAPAEDSFDPNILVRDDHGWHLTSWRCNTCTRASLGRASRCRVCGSTDGAEARLETSGTLATWSRIAGKSGPYVVGYADLGVAGHPGAAVRVFGPIPVATEDDLTTGMPVKVVFEGSPVVHHEFLPEVTGADR
jgi:CoA:oxalate CoA-transferase